jgi:hypothetical protein
MLSAIASLVHVRTVLLEPLYTAPPFRDLEHVFSAFEALHLARGDAEGSPLWHLKNVVAIFEALVDVFEKQTKYSRDLSTAICSVEAHVRGLVKVCRRACMIFHKSSWLDDGDARNS